MHRVLVYGLEAIEVGRHLGAAGYSVASIALSGTSTEVVVDLLDVFCGHPPQALVADLTRSIDCLPVRRLRAAFHEIWGDNTAFPPSLALITDHHLAAPELPALVDDFMLPAFEPCEVKTRIAFLMFRHRHVRSNNTLLCADLTLDLNKCTATDEQGRVLKLTPREFSLLAFLCSHRGRFFSRTDLVNLVWGIQFDGGERTVDIHIRRLRSKMPAQAATYLETRRSIGYGMHIP